MKLFGKKPDVKGTSNGQGRLTLDQHAVAGIC